MAEPYEIAIEPPRPTLPGTVVVRESVDDLIDAVASDLLLHAFNCVREFGDFHLALSGGSTPVPLYRRLMYDPNYRSLPWKRTHLWLVDDRRVAFNDDRSNFKLIRELIVDHSDIPPEQVHPIFALGDRPDLAYEQQLREHLGWREKGQDRPDYVLLGMGDDGHTASLMPGSPILDDARLVTLADGGEDDPGRVTMTLHLINASRFVGVMVTGQAKRAAVARVAGRVGSVGELPILGVAPLAGELRWYLDWEACPRPEA
jgi:6-phosphogluconolactonase